MPQGGAESTEAQPAPQTARSRISPQHSAEPGLPSPGPAIPFPSPLILLVLDFEDRAARIELRWLPKELTDMLVAELSRRPDLILLRQERLDEAIRDRSLPPTGRIADETRLQIGRVLGATVLVSGSLTVGKGNVRFDSRLIDVEEGTVLGTATSEGSIDHAPAVATELARKIVRLLPDPDNGVVDTRSR